jgi:hypothetical protein
MHIFWIAGLLLALIEFPNFSTFLKRIALSTEKIARMEPEETAGQISPGTIATARQVDEVGELSSRKAEGVSKKLQAV